MNFDIKSVATKQLPLLLLFALAGLLPASAMEAHAKNLTPSNTAAKSRPAGKNKYLTLTVNISPLKNAFSGTAWGRVTSKEGVCAIASCGYHIRPGVTIHLKAGSVNSKKHPFRHWVLPNGKHPTSKKVTLKITKTELVAARFK